MDEYQAEVVFAYTRRQAIADGVLIDVSDQAREAGFKLPVCVSDHLYHGYLVPPEGMGEGQSVEGRLHDLFTMTKAAMVTRWEDNRVYYQVLFKMPRSLDLVKCLAVVGPGDDMEPVITLMLPEDE